MRRGSSAGMGSAARRTALGTAVALLVLPALAAASGPGTAAMGTPVAWVVPSTLRVQIGAPAGSQTEVRLEAARGETESFQVAVRARGGALSGVSVAVSALRRPGGGEIAGASIALFREHYVKVPRHSPGWSGRPLRWTWFPDALVPFVDPVTGRPPRSGARYPAVPFAVRAARNQPVWVDVTVPRDAAPGVYAGTWAVTTAQGRRSGPVSLRVRDVGLPVVPSSGSRFGIWQQANRRAAVEDLLLRYRVQPSPATTAREGVMHRRGLGSARLDYRSGADVDHCTMKAAPSVDLLRAAAATHDRNLRLYDYSADEVSGCKGLTAPLAAWGRALHAAGIDHLVTVRPRPDLMDDGTGRPVVDVWVQLPWQLRAMDPVLRERVLSAGGELWSYQALVQGWRTPSWQLDFPVANYRILGGFLNASQGVTGLLYWAVDRWQRDPWSDPTYVHTDSCCYPGDGTLVYPGAPAGVVGVVPSVRLAMVRDGMDDYDYVSALNDRGLGSEAARIIAPAASSWSQWSVDWRVLADVRRQLLDLLEATNP